MSVIENKFYPRDQLGCGQYVKGSKLFHNNNIPREQGFYIHCQDGVKRKKPTSFLFWALIVFLAFMAVANLILTLVFLGVLRLGHGMESLELFSEKNIVRLSGTTDLDVVYKRDGHIDGFKDAPMEAIGDTDSVVMRLARSGDVAPSIDIGVDRETIIVDAFEVKHPKTCAAVFSTEYPNFGLPGGVNKLDVQKAQTKRIASPLDSGLSIKSESYVKLKGSEGTRMDGKEVVWSADQDIFLKSVNKSIILSGSEGVYIDIKSIPIAYTYNNTKGHNQFKICVCMPSGKLFRVPVVGAETSCLLGDVDPFTHPCLY